MNRVKDKFVLVTGGGSGIGAGIAHRLAQEGSVILVSDISYESAKQTVSSIKRDGGTAHAIAHDVTKENEWTTVIKYAEEIGGRLDALVNSAGIFSETGQPFEGISFSEWRKIMDVNLDGTFLGCKAAVLSMKGRGGGSIVNIGSVTGFRGTPAGAAYGTSKGAVSTLTKHVAYSCANYKIRVNAVHPGHIWTPANARKSIGQYGDERSAKEALMKRNPSGILGTPDDVGHLVVYLVSEESRMMTGADLVIDGGRLAS
jgi:NAD(P)-dependent dehydrogenase (short-subunit alcohol dehydrogenase family)